MSISTPPRTMRAVITGAVLALLAVIAVPTAASAHDQLVSSDPAADARLDAAPDTVTLQFSAAIMTTGLAMTVIDADGVDHLTEDPVAEGTTVTAALNDLPTGGYQVRWRVVSSDGHPISGYIPFTVGDAAPLPAPTTAGDTDDDDADDVDAADATASSSTDAAPAADDSGVLRTVLIGAAGAVVAVGVLVVIVVLNRRSHRDEPGETPSASSTSTR